MPLVYIKDFNASIDNKPFLDQPVKKQTKAYRNDKKKWLYKTELIDFSYHQNYYKLIGTDLSRQT